MSGVVRRVYFVDTSYLTELYAIPECSDPQATKAVRARFSRAWLDRDALIVPLGCLLEVGNHIANIKNPKERNHRAELLNTAVASATDQAERQPPFVLVDAPPAAEMATFVAEWCSGHVRAGRGLVDAAIAERAKQHKRLRAGGILVHIWTRDRALKGLEPDKEDDPFI